MPSGRRLRTLLQRFLILQAAFQDCDFMLEPRGVLKASVQRPAIQLICLPSFELVFWSLIAKHAPVHMVAPAWVLEFELM